MGTYIPIITNIGGIKICGHALLLQTGTPLGVGPGVSTSVYIGITIAYARFVPTQPGTTVAIAYTMPMVGTPCQFGSWGHLPPPDVTSCRGMIDATG